MDANESVVKQSGTEQIQVPQFGAVDADLLDAAKSYHCNIYSMSAAGAKAVSEHTAFTAKFESQSMRTAFIDLWDNQGKVVVEIERNTKPKDISVRYPRDRWNVLEAQSKGSEGAKLAVRTEYAAPALGDEVLSGVAEALKIPGDLMQKIILRVNYKDQTYGIIFENELLSTMPGDATSSKAVVTSPSQSPEVTAPDSASAPSASESSETAPTETAVPKEPPVTESAPLKSRASKAVSAQRSEMDQQQKYATYSRSEVDQLLKQQAEQLANALGTKVTSQQRAFQETIDKQEKSFAKLSDSFALSLDAARTKLESTAKGSTEETRNELDKFKTQLGKELEAYRAQLNKAASREVTKPQAAALAAAAPVAKTERSIPSPAGPVAVGAPQRDHVVMGLLVAAIIAAMVNMVTIMLSVGDVKQHLMDIDAKLSQMSSSSNSPKTTTTTTTTTPAITPSTSP